MAMENARDAGDLQQQVIQWLAQQGDPVYLVGGSVRDRLLGRPVYDMDLAVPEEARRLARRLAGHFGGAYFALDDARDTGRAILRAADGDRLFVDVARFRAPGLLADLADRDLTINAMSADVHAPDEVIDPFNGRDDLQAGVIRPVGPESIRHDPVRALRAIRQAAELGFVLAPEAEDLIRRDGQGLVDISVERIRDEVARLLMQPNAAAFLRKADDLGLLALIFPELAPLRGLSQPAPHVLDALAHSFETVQALEEVVWVLFARQEQSLRTVALKQAGRRGPRGPGGRYADRLADLDLLAPHAARIARHVQAQVGEVRCRLVTLKLAALLHDTGKSVSSSIDERGRLRFLGHEQPGAAAVREALRRLRMNQREVRLGETIVRHHMRPLLLAGQDEVSPRAVYRFFRDTQEDGVEVLLHSLADHLATYAPGASEPEWPRLVALVTRMLADYWERRAERVAPPSLVDGNDLQRELGLPPGPQIGALLEAVREAQVLGEVATREQALALALHRMDEETDQDARPASAAANSRKPD